VSRISLRPLLIRKIILDRSFHIRAQICTEVCVCVRCVCVCARMCLSLQQAVRMCCVCASVCTHMHPTKQGAGKVEDCHIAYFHREGCHIEDCHIANFNQGKFVYPNLQQAYHTCKNTTNCTLPLAREVTFERACTHARTRARIYTHTHTY
jgi:hypothetical protein